MAFVYSLLSWIPFVSFDSNQEKCLSFDNIEQLEIDAPPVPEPPQAVANQMKMAHELENSGWNVEPPNYGETHSHFQKVWKDQFFVALKRIDSPIWNADAVKQHVSEVAENNNELLWWYLGQLLGAIAGLTLIWIISIVVTWRLDSTVFEKVSGAEGVLTILFLLITSIGYTLYRAPARMSLRGVNPTSYSEETPAHIKEKAKLVHNSAPNVNTIVYKVGGTPWRFITASCGDPETEVCIANWKKPGSD